MKLLYIFILLFLYGCGEQPKVKNVDAVLSANGCGSSKQQAKEMAKLELSSILEVKIESTFERNVQSSERKFIKANSHISKSHTNIMLKRIEYSNYHIKTEWFKPDVHCIDVCLNKKSLAAYKSDIVIEHSEINKEISASNNNIQYKDKQALIDRLLRKIDNHNKFVQTIISVDPSLKSFIINETSYSLKNKINAIPSVNFKIKKCSGIVYVRCKAQFTSDVKDDEASVKYLWDFGDGKYSKKVHPIHRYRSLGDYDVTLEITDAKGIKTTQTKYLKVQNRAPVARFELDENEYSLVDYVSFFNKSYDTDGKVRKYYWNFGDNEISRKANPKHQYSIPGRYKITLKVTDNSGYSAKTTKTITIKHPVEVDIKKGMTLKHVRLLIGSPEQSIKKFNSTTHAYLYHHNWVLTQNNTVECVVKEDGFEKSIFGYPKSCQWHMKNRFKYVQYD